MPKNILLIILSLLSFITAKAQYLGGKGDGHAMAETKNIVLGNSEIPGIFYAINIYPNPANTNDDITFIINGLQSSFYAVKIYNMQGVEVYKDVIINSQSLTINLSAKHFSRGVYMAEITGTDNAKAIHRKLIIL